MGVVRISILAGAALAAILLAVVVRGMLAPPPAPKAELASAPEAAKPMARVLVAKRDLPIGTRLVAGDMTWQEWPADGLNPAFVTDGAVPAASPADGTDKAIKTASRAATEMVATPGAIQAFEGAIVREALLKGEPVVARKVVRAGKSNYMAVVVEPGMRAMAIPINAETAAGGFILPGDRVDVLQSRDMGQGVRVTETLMRNTRVLAIDQQTVAGKDSNAIVGAVATLEVPAQDAEILARGKAQGEMQLALRSYADAAGGPTRGGGQSRGNGVKVYKAGAVTEFAAQ
jgi:pilus assembly protein CpaB